MSLTLRTTVVGSWPPEDRFRPELQRYFRGELAEREAEELLRAVAAVAIGQQRGLDLDVYTGGETSADTFVLHFARRLSGVRPSSNPEAWDGRGAYEVVDTIAAPRGLGIAEAFRRERGLAPELFKVTLPGPSELTTQLQPADARRGCWPAIMGLLRAEIAELIVAGTREVQLDLPQIAMGLADGGWETDEAVDVIGELLAGLPAGIRRSVHLCYGDFGARTWTRNRTLRPLLPLLQRLDGLVDCVVLELSLPSSGRSATDCPSYRRRWSWPRASSM
jgi:methionine synthase II (cobalamin-independent)